MASGRRGGEGPASERSAVLTLLLLEFGFGVAIFVRGNEVAELVLTLLLLEFGFGDNNLLPSPLQPERGLNPSFTGIWLRGEVEKALLANVNQS